MPSMEERLSTLEDEVGRLKKANQSSNFDSLPWWEKIRGTFKDDPDYDDAMRLGREWRESFRPKDNEVAEK